MSTRHPLYPERHSLLLDGLWDFAWLGDTDAVAFRPAAHDAVFDEIAAVPGCYNLAGSRIGGRGAGLYRTRFAFPSGHARLCFGGLGLYARVWLDGHDLAEIKNPYATIAIDTDIRPAAGGGDRHELLVLVDNRFDPARVPVFRPSSDFYGYGGIYRSVTLTRLPDTRVERVKITTLDIATGRVRLEARLGGRIPQKLRIRYAFDGGAPAETVLAAPAGKQPLVIETQVPGHRVWSPEHPALHTLSFGISCAEADGPFEEGDAVIEQFGIRTITTLGREILLNGSPVRLLGLNRHESHPQFGPAQPGQLIADDLQWARELNANFIRAVHYQPDSGFLDACDRAGFLVWAESLGWAQPESDAQDPEIVALHRHSAIALVDACLNHPSVIIYAFLNESCSDTPDGRRLYQNLAQTLRDADSSRLISYASNRFEKDLCFDLADIISINPYPGWIGGFGDMANDPDRLWTTPVLARIRPEIDRLARYFAETPAHAQKPLLVSEIGACGLYGVRDRARAQWSEEFQQDYFDEAVRAVLDNPRYAGIALWQMFDNRSFVNTGPSVRTKPRGYNNAGLLDEYRRPKLAFDTVKELFRRYGGTM
ncbi:beta-galactosidase/beta-glucuronidase [Opitutaceae bacterium TAV1]|nr:beta-galactosidase/beta-glucuronidase [Opitutaceae bacterium TAV1]